MKERMKERMKDKISIQGDVMLIRRDGLPDGLRKREDGTLALGEHTGHSHRIFGAAVMEAENGTRYVGDVRANALLRHVKEDLSEADHLPIVLEEGGCYEVRLQKKYNPWSEVWDRVID